MYKEKKAPLSTDRTDQSSTNKNNKTIVHIQMIPLVKNDWNRLKKHVLLEL